MPWTTKKPAVRDPDQVEALVEQFRYLPAHVLARTRRPCSCTAEDLEDALQEGFLGLMRAAELWEPARGTKFGTYAFTAVQNRIIRYFRSVGLIRIPDHLWKDGPGQRPRRLGDDRFLLDIADDSADPAAVSDQALLLEQALAVLTTAERRLLERHYIKGETFASMGSRWGVTRQRIEQKVKAVLRKVRAELGVLQTSHAADAPSRSPPGATRWPSSSLPMPSTAGAGDCAARSRPE